MDNNNSDAPLKVTINGQEYDPADAETLIETGRKTKEYEEKYNTSLDKVWPEYTRVAQERKQLADELAEAKAQLTEFQSKKLDGSETPSDIAQAKEAAKKLGIPLMEDLESSYIKKDDLPKMFQQFQSEQQAVQQVLNEADKLEKEINGSDGRPKFNKKAVLAYASAYGMSDLTQAYEDMHNDVITAWKEQQIAQQKAKSLKTLGGGGSKSPSTPRLSNDNIKDALNEALYGASE